MGPRRCGGRLSRGILLAPKDGVGVAVLVNLEDSPIVDAVGYSLLDAALGLPKKDWNGF